MGPHRIGWIKKLISYPLLVCFLFSQLQMFLGMRCGLKVIAPPILFVGL